MSCLGAEWWFSSKWMFVRDGGWHLALQLLTLRRLESADAAVVYASSARAGQVTRRALKALGL